MEFVGEVELLFDRLVRARGKGKGFKLKKLRKMMHMGICSKTGTSGVF